MGPSLAGKPQPKVRWDSERDTAISKKAKELLASDPEIKALDATNPYLAWRKAIAKAAAAIPPKDGGFGGGQGDVERSQGDAKLSREHDAAIHKAALKLHAEDPECIRLNRTSMYEGFKLAVKKAMRVDTDATSTSEQTPAQTAALTRPVLERARQVHRGAMILLSSDSTLKELAAKDYPKAFDVAHSAADGEKAALLLVPLKTDANALKPGSREERVYDRALTTLKTALQGPRPL